MHLIIDVHYTDSTATVAGVCVNDINAASPERIVTSQISDIAPYESGQFYKRELPCILQLVKEHQLAPAMIIVDGYVHFGSETQPGLGMHLYNEFHAAVPVIGVAKNKFKSMSNAFAVLRGESKKPLYVTSVGVSLPAAQAIITNMHGRYRLPTLLKLADSACRSH